jgi:hypothetical protein
MVIICIARRMASEYQHREQLHPALRPVQSRLDAAVLLMEAAMKCFDDWRKAQPAPHPIKS